MNTPSDIPVAPVGAAALLRRGVLLPARGEAAASLGCFLTRGLGLDPAYLEERVQTLLRNGLAVDDLVARPDDLPPSLRLLATAPPAGLTLPQPDLLWIMHC